MSTNPNNKRIAINTIIIYLRMFLGALIGFFTTRYVLEALGVSDYGLFNVVGGVISMLNFLSVGMHTTTRRYVNVEMGKKDGEVKKVFNVCLVLHIGFALLIYLVAISIGLWYINNMLNAPHDKKYSILAYIPLVKVLLLLLIYYAIFRCLRLDTLPLQLFGFVTTIIVSSLLCLILGMTEHERKETVGKVLKKLY